jgi:hypothetical protein
MTVGHAIGRHISNSLMRLAILLVAALLSSSFAGRVLAQSVSSSANDALEIQSGFVNIVNGVYQLQVRVRYPMNDEDRRALQQGVSLFYDVDLEVTRERRFWTAASVVNLSLRRELSYHSVSERYLVKDPQGVVETRSFASFEEALADLGKVDGWPILVSAQVAENGEYFVNVRAVVRRGRLTDALRALMFWSDDWQRRSEWYSWSLPR